MEGAALTGEALMKLYTQWKSSSPFALTPPPPDRLKAVASEYIRHQDWNSAVSVGHDLAKSHPALAADIACTLMQSVPAQDNDYRLLSQMLPWLQAAEKYAEVIQVSNPTLLPGHVNGDAVLLQPLLF